MDHTVYLVDISDLKDVSNLCRLCLLDGTNMISLYEETEHFNEKTTTILQELQYFSEIKLTEDPRYPSFICEACLSMLNTSWKIRLQMKLSQTQLLKHFNVQMAQENLPQDRIMPQIAPVEIISNKGRFNLKQLIIVEDEQQEEDKKCYEGFLRNLGSVISANFADESISNKKDILEDPIVNIIPLASKEGIGDNKNTHLAMRRSIRKKQLSNETFLCQVCGFTATRKHQLKYHMTSKHSIKRYKCDICNKGFSERHRLEHHRSVHKNERRYLCTICGNNFNYLSALEYHMRMHTGERRYKCSYCPKAFSMSWGLKRHLTIHTGARPYSCRYCSKGFASSGERKCHELLHTDEKPYRCQVCSKGTRKNYNLKRHMLSHHGPVKCNFCQLGFLDVSLLKLHCKISHCESIGVNDAIQSNAVCESLNDDEQELEEEIEEEIEHGFDKEDAE